MIKSDTVLHSVPGVRLTTFPTAMTIKFSVSFHDDVGVEFYATSSRVRFRLHKYVACYFIDKFILSAAVAELNCAGY